jgi:hypothetical protein
VTAVEPKEALRDLIPSLTDEQAKEALEFVQLMQRQALYDRLRKDLGPNSGIHVPLRARKREDFEPIKGTGIPLSKLLINDRR